MNTRQQWGWNKVVLLQIWGRPKVHNAEHNEQEMTDTDFPSTIHNDKRGNTKLQCECIQEFLKKDLKYVFLSLLCTAVNVLGSFCLSHWRREGQWWHLVCRCCGCYWQCVGSPSTTKNDILHNVESGRTPKPHPLKVNNEGNQTMMLLLNRGNNQPNEKATA